MRAVATLLGALVMAATAAQPAPADPPKDDPFPDRVTLTGFDKAGKQTFVKQGVKARSRVNKVGESVWDLSTESLDGREEPKKGYTITDKDGQVWVTIRVADFTMNGLFTCTVTKHPKN